MAVRGAAPRRPALLFRAGAVRDLGGIITPVLSGLWHGGITFGLAGAAGVLSKSRNREA